MNIAKIRTAWLAGLLVCGRFAVQGAIATGDYSLSFGTNLQLWDFSGSYTDYLSNVPLEYTISMDPSGKLTVAGTGSFIDGADYLNFLNFMVSLTGTTRTAGKVVRVGLSLKMVGSGQVEAYD